MRIRRDRRSCNRSRARRSHRCRRCRHERIAPRRAAAERWSVAFDGAEPEDRSFRRRLKRLPERRVPSGARGRELATRFKRPLIGIALAATAGPMVKATRPPPPHRSSPSPNLQPLVSSEPEGSIEDRVGEVWTVSVRDRTIEQAIERYQISEPLAADIHDEAVDADIEPELAYGLVNTESSFKNRAVSHVGARGLTQVMPRTARWLQPGITNEDLFDQKTNLRLGFNYLRDLIDKYDGDVRLALLAYNRGPGTVDRVLARGGDPDNGYADKVMGG